MLWGVRLLAVVGTVASVLVPTWARPVETITAPVTLARSVRVLAGPGGTRFAFPPTHIAFSWSGDEGTGVEFRTVDASGVVSEWARAPEAHDLEDGRRRYSGVVAAARPARIEWRPVAPAGTRMGAITLDYLNTLDGPRRRVAVPAVASAAEASVPTIVTRARWGADESLKSTSGGCDRDFFRVRQLFVHHTAGANFDDRPKATMRAIYWYHTVRRGWCDLGYNFVVSWDGRVFEGRWARQYAPWEVHTSETRTGRAVAGAHVSGFNSGSVGVSLMGNFTSMRPPPAMKRSLAELLAWEVDRHGLAPRGEHVYRNPETGLRARLPYIAGHRDAGSTACPGSRLYSSLPGVRRAVADVMGAGRTTTHLTLERAARKVAYGEGATFTGRLTDDAGVPLAGRSVAIWQRFAVDPWTRAATATTAADGTFGYTVEPERNVTVAAVYAGDSATWGSQTRDVAVRVAPDVSLEAEGGTVDLGGVHHYPSGTTSVVHTGDVVPPHPHATVTVRVAKLRDDGSFDALVAAPARLDAASAYRYRFVAPGGDPTGAYRVVTRFRRDGDHAGSRSAPLFFVID